MVWDKSVPAGSRGIRLGDDDIREFKSDIEAALTASGVFPGPDTTNPVYHYAPPRGTTGLRPLPSSNTIGRLYINTTTQTVQRDNGTAWDDVATVIPTGTVIPFFQATAPLGWTKVTTYSDRTLRVVDGVGGGFGGTSPISTGLTHDHGIASSGLGLTSQMVDTGDPHTCFVFDLNAGSGSHVHYLATHTHDFSHDHDGSTTATSPTFQYLDVIMCQKD